MLPLGAARLEPIDVDGVGGASRELERLSERRAPPPPLPEGWNCANSAWREVTGGSVRVDRPPGDMRLMLPLLDIRCKGAGVDRSESMRAPKGAFWLKSTSAAEGGADGGTA